MKEIDSIEYEAGFETTAESENGTKYRFRIDFYLFKEDGRYISYCPALELASSGENHNEAIANFYEAFQLFVETCEDDCSLVEVLKSLGWKITNATITPPSFSFLMKNPDFSSIIESQVEYERIVSHPLEVDTVCAH